MEKIYFYLPEFFQKEPLNLVLLKVMEMYPECFYENIQIGAVYGAFPGQIWNGGRLVLGTRDKKEIEQTIKSYNEKNIPCRFTYTNPVLGKEHIFDTYCNLCTRIGHNGKNEILVNSEILEKYLREKYPQYKYISSTTKCLRTKEMIEKEALKDYYLVVLDYRLNNTDMIFELKNPEKFELLLNAYCVDDCPNREEHYRAIGEAQLEHTTTDMNRCPYLKSDFYDTMENRSFIRVEDVFGKYYDAGFRHFKIEGRTISKYKVLESYMYYLVKPKYRDITRSAVLRVLEKMENKGLN